MYLCPHLRFQSRKCDPLLRNAAKGMIFDPLVLGTPLVSHKTSHDIVPSEATTCDERSHRMRSELRLVTSVTAAGP